MEPWSGIPHHMVGSVAAGCPGRSVGRALEVDQNQSRFAPPGGRLA